MHFSLFFLFSYNSEKQNVHINTWLFTCLWLRKNDGDL